MNRRSVKRWGLIAGAGGLLALGTAAWTVFADYRQLPPLPKAADLSVSTVVLDREDRLLRAFTSTDSKWRLPVSLEEIDPLYFELLLALRIC